MSLQILSVPVIPLWCCCTGAGFFLYFVSWYDILETRRSRASGWRLFPPSLMKGGGAMVTYAELFQLLMLLVAFAGLIFQISSKRK